MRDAFAAVLLSFHFFFFFFFFLHLVAALFLLFPTFVLVLVVVLVVFFVLVFVLFCIGDGTRGFRSHGRFVRPATMLLVDMLIRGSPISPPCIVRHGGRELRLQRTVGADLTRGMSRWFAVPRYSLRARLVIVDA